MIKVKADWYVSVHKAKESILYDRNIVSLILENKLDDIKSVLPDQDRVRLEKFETEVVESIDLLIERLHLITVQYNASMRMTRKDFALSYPYGTLKSLVFAVWEKHSIDDCRTAVLNVVRKSLTSNANWSKLNEELFGVSPFNEN